MAALILALRDENGTVLVFFFLLERLENNYLFIIKMFLKKKNRCFLNGRPERKAIESYIPNNQQATRIE